MSLSKVKRESNNFTPKMYVQSNAQRPVASSMHFSRKCKSSRTLSNKRKKTANKGERMKREKSTIYTWVACSLISMIKKESQSVSSRWRTHTKILSSPRIQVSRTFMAVKDYKIPTHMLIFRSQTKAI